MAATAKTPDDGKMTPWRARALERMRRGPIRLGEVDVGVRRALIACGWAVTEYERGRGWSIEITDSGREELAAWDARVAEKERMWRTPK